MTVAVHGTNTSIIQKKLVTVTDLMNHSRTYSITYSDEVPVDWRKNMICRRQKL